MHRWALVVVLGTDNTKHRKHWHHVVGSVPYYPLDPCGVIIDSAPDATISIYIPHTLSTLTCFYNICYFKFDISLVLKCSTGTVRTEVDALRFLNNCGLDLPIPRVIDIIVVGEQTFTLMTRIPRELLVKKFEAMSDVQLDIVQDVFAVLRSLWTLRQPTPYTGKVMLSASGHGMPNPVRTFEDLEGTFVHITT